MEGSLVFESLLLCFLIILVRFFYLMYKVTTGNTAAATQKRSDPSRTIICVGSGGHTTEIIEIMKSLDFTKYTPRYYVQASTDHTSTSKILDFERAKGSSEHDFEIVKIPRSRIVGQSYLTSVITTLYSILYSIPLVLRIRPDLILCNGPGTCIPICAITFALKAAFISNARIVFVESFCRTKSFSLTGKILFYLADNIVVQWPYLKRKLRRATYIGQLM